VQWKEGEGQGHNLQLNLGVTEGGPFTVDAGTIATGRTCVIGASGSGKSYAVAVICEELCKNKVPFAIVDTEGEYSGLKDKYEAILISNDEGADLNWSGLDFGELAEQAPDIAPLILDTSDLEDPKDVVQKLLQQLYSVLSQRRTPYLVIIEEADRFVPQSGVRVQAVGEIARRGRKRGIGLMVCTQRPSLVDKNILSQCGDQLIGKLVIQNDLQAVSQFFSSKGIPRVLTTLEAGSFYAMGGLSDHPVLVKIRKRETRHGGYTPELKERVVRPFMGTLLRQNISQQLIGAKQGPEEVRSDSMIKEYMGFPLIIQEEDVPLKVNRSRSHGFFGEKEKVTAMSLEWRPLYVVTVLRLEGLLRKEFKAHFVVLDGVTGCEVELGEGVEFKSGLKGLLGLSERDLRTLRGLDERTTTTVPDLEGKVGYPRGVIRRALSRLESMKLVSSYDGGRSKLFRRLVRIHELKLLEQPPPSQPLKSEMMKGRIVPKDRMINESDVRETMKGLLDDSDATEFSVIYYPIWKVELTRGSSRRTVWIDGRSGRQLELPFQLR